MATLPSANAMRCPASWIKAPRPQPLSVSSVVNPRLTTSPASGIPMASPSSSNLASSASRFGLRLRRRCRRRRGAGAPATGHQLLVRLVRLLPGDHHLRRRSGRQQRQRARGADPAGVRRVGGRVGGDCSGAGAGAAGKAEVVSKPKRNSKGW